MNLKYTVFFIFLLLGCRTRDVGSGIKTNSEAECRYYVAISGSNFKEFKAELQAWRRIKPVFISSRENLATLEIQERERRLDSYKGMTLKWNMSSGGTLKTEGKPGLSKVVYQKNKEVVADVTDAIERNKFAITNSNAYLSLSLRILSANGKKELVGHSWGAQSVALDKLPPFQTPSEQNKTNPSFPWVVADEFVLAPTAIGSDTPSQVKPSPKKIKRGSAHGLKFGTSKDTTWLNLYRQCN